MFGFGAKSAAKKLMSTISRFSVILSSQKDVFPFGGNVSVIEPILVGMSCLFAASYAKNKDIAYELVPAYQKKIMPAVNEAEYNRRTQLLQDYYDEFRTCAIDIQENQTQELFPVVEKFAEITANHLGVDFTRECYATLCACIIELLLKINPALRYILPQ